MALLADQLYGPTGKVQPDPIAAQAVGSGALPPSSGGANNARTTAHVTGPLANPTLALVLVLGLAVVLVNFSVHGGFEIRG